MTEPSRGDGRPAERFPTSRLDAFLAATDDTAALAAWLGTEVTDLDAARRRLSRDIVALDRLINDQLNQILHHPSFQQLESSWRGLKYLVDQCPAGEHATVKIKLLNVSWKEIARDVERAVEFDQSQLFRKIYDNEFGIAGGEPFGVLIGDYQIRHRLSADHQIDDLAVLEAVSQVAAAAFAPFICAAHASMFGLEDFRQLERPLNLTRTFEQPEYTRWRSLRAREESRFVGLVMPRALIRLPYQPNDVWGQASGETQPRRGLQHFGFREEVRSPGRDKYLWANAVYPFAAVLTRTFMQSGWLADIRGTRRGEEGSGLVTGLPAESHETDSAGVALKMSVEVAVGDAQERELADLGFIPLLQCKDTGYCAFYSNQSIQKAAGFRPGPAATNARISTMLQYMLCVSRFAHYLKVMARARIGSMTEERELQDALGDWLRLYIADDDNASESVKAKFPLRQAQVEVIRRPDSPGSYACTMHLMPHFQLDALSASVVLRTELAPARQ